MASFLIIASLASGLAATSAPEAAVATAPAPVVLAQAQGNGNDGNNGGSRGGADCYGAAAQAAAELGGQVLSVRSSGGTCVVTVLIPGSGNERPRKVTMRVSQ